MSLLPVDPRVTRALDAPAPASDPTSAARAAEEFEAYMVAFLAQQLRATLPEGPFTQGPMAMFASLFDQEIGQRVAERGGLGLREQVERALAALDPGQAPPRAGPPSAARVTSRFGLRADPLTTEVRFHRGVDLALAEGHPVRALTGGTVRFAGERGGYGNVVIVRHDDGSEARYAHCSALAVREGDRVEAGARLGAVGQTGRATGPHLHLELWRDGEAVDPQGWMASQGGEAGWR